MKRESLTQIVFKAQRLSVEADRNTQDIDKVKQYLQYIKAINKAAVNEIIRLDSAPAPSYDLANRSLPGAASVFDQIANVLANTPGSGYEFLKDRK